MLLIDLSSFCVELKMKKSEIIIFISEFTSEKRDNTLFLWKTSEAYLLPFSVLISFSLDLKKD